MSEKKNLMTKQLTIKLDEGRHRKLKVYVCECGVTITEVVSGFIDSL